MKTLLIAMNMIITLIMLLLSFSSFAVDIDRCSETVKAKQMEIFEKSNSIDKAMAGVIQKYTITIGYSKLSCDQYGRQLNTILEYIELNK